MMTRKVLLNMELEEDDDEDGDIGECRSPGRGWGGGGYPGRTPLRGSRSSRATSGLFPATAPGAPGFTTHLSRILRGHRLRRSTGQQRHKQKGWSGGRGAGTRGDAGRRMVARFHQASGMSKRSLSRPPDTFQSKFRSWVWLFLPFRFHSLTNQRNLVTPWSRRTWEFHAAI